MPPTGILWEFSDDPAGHGWVCDPMGAPPGRLVTCATPGLTLPPAGRSNLILRIFLPAGTNPGDLEDNCAEITAPADDPDGNNRDCAPFEGAEEPEPEPEPGPDLAIEKSRILDCQTEGAPHGGTICSFAVSVVNEGDAEFNEPASFTD